MKRDRRPLRSDLPSVRIPRLRAEGIITEATTDYLVRLGDVEVEAEVIQLRFPSGGGWSLFLCPACGGKARALWLFEGKVICRKCCIAAGVRNCTHWMSDAERAVYRAEKLKARLEGRVEVRLRPTPSGGRLLKRRRQELALMRAELEVRRAALEGWR